MPGNLKASLRVIAELHAMHDLFIVVPTCRTMPTHFIAVRVSHAEEIVAAIQRVQAALVQHDSALEEALVEAITAHLTLMVCCQSL